VTTHLTERLRDLADEAPAPLSASGLWREGQSRHRRRIVTVAAVVGAFVALAAGTGYGSWHSRQPDPAAPPATNSGPMAIPDRFFTPSPWLSSTATPGRLVAVLHATRDHFPWGSANDQIVGVSAGSQRYRFIDLPQRSTADLDVALSPDGRHLAYWISGPTRKQTSYDWPPVTGIAIDDLTTGQVETHQIASDYGLVGETLQWTDASTVVVECSRFLRRQGAFSSGPFLRAYRVGSRAWTALPGASQEVVQSEDVFADMPSYRRIDLYDPRTGKGMGHVRLSQLVWKAALDPAGGRVAGIWAGSNRSGPPSKLLVGMMRHGRVTLQRPPATGRYYGVLGWADARHIVATTSAGTNGLALVSVDVVTGSQRVLVRTPWTEVEIAADALEHPVTAPAVVPPTPWNPRPIAAWSLLALVLLSGGAFLVRWARVRH
jgi:hypothetical protein